MTIEEKIERHQKFLNAASTDRPLLGFCINSWTGSGEIGAYSDLNPPGDFPLEGIDRKALIAFYKKYTAAFGYDDDLFEDVCPLPIYPWMEAAAGCKINYSGTDMWAKHTMNPVLPDTSVYRSVLDAYKVHLEILSGEYGKTGIPITHSLLRGVVDTLHAVINPQDAIYLMYDDEAFTQSLLTEYESIYLSFIAVQKQLAPSFHGGYVVGRHKIWAPGFIIRLQEDAATLLSPEMFERFAVSHIKTMVKTAPYSLIHTHSSWFHNLDSVLAIPDITIIQVVKDEGASLEQMLPSLKKIQAKGKCLNLKAKLTGSDLQVISRELDRQGLCIEIVVADAGQADETKAFFCRLYK